MNIGLTVFGATPQYPSDEIMLEYKQYVEQNSKFKLNITYNKYPPLQQSEIGYWSQQNPPCYFVSPWSLSPETKAKIPNNVKCNIVAWDTQGANICWAGGTWGPDHGLHGISFVSIPFGWAPAEPWGPWKYTYSQAYVHEWLHAVDIILNILGYPDVPSADECGKYGYDGTNDSGWANCYKFMLSTITDEMYAAISDECTPMESSTIIQQ